MLLREVSLIGHLTIQRCGANELPIVFVLTVPRLLAMFELLVISPLSKMMEMGTICPNKFDPNATAGLVGPDPIAHAIPGCIHPAHIAHAIFASS